MDLLKIIIEALGLDFEDVRELSEANKQTLRENCRNLRTGNCWVIEGFIITDNARSWEYYAGFEYLEDEQKHTIQIYGEKITAYEGDRVDEYLDILQGESV